MKKNAVTARTDEPWRAMNALSARDEMPAKKPYNSVAARRPERKRRADLKLSLNFPPPAAAQRMAAGPQQVKKQGPDNVRRNPMPNN